VCWYFFPLFPSIAHSDCSFSGTFSINAGWLCLAPFAFVILISWARSNSQKTIDTSADIKLESDLQREVARTKASDWAPTWTAPKLPSSVIASIWTNRFVHRSTQPPSKIQRYGTALRGLTGGYGRAAPYIIGAALLSLRDAGLITISADPRGKVFDSFQRVRIERTDMALSSLDMPAVEGGLLLAVLDLAHRRFRKETQPAAYWVVTEWIHHNQANPSKWVVEVAVQQGRELGLYEPAVKVRAWYGKMVDDKPVYLLEHLAACDDQAVACAARWHEFEAEEPEMGRLVTEVAFAIEGRRERGG
jgi:hypothetical protein